MFTHVHVHVLLRASRTRLILLRERVACYTKSAYCPILYSTIFGNAQARRARALLFPIPKVNNHYGMDPEEFIHFITCCSHYISYIICYYMLLHLSYMSILHQQDFIFLKTPLTCFNPTKKGHPQSKDQSHSSNIISICQA